MAPDACQPDGDKSVIAPADWVREIRRHTVARPSDNDGAAAARVREERDAREQQVMRAIRRNA